MRGMVPEDVYDLAAVSDPRLSPDGRNVAFVLTTIDSGENDYRSSIWLVPADGSSSPRRFTSGTKRDTAPRWSPDGTQLAFLSTRDGDKAQVHVIPAGGGEARKLTDLKGGAAEPAWSPDGSRIAFHARVPAAEYDEEDERKRAPRRFTRLRYKLDNVGWTGDRPAQIFVVAADGSSEPVQLTHGKCGSTSPSWSPDGTQLAYISGREEDWDVHPARDIWLIEASGGEPRLLTHADGSCSGPSWNGGRIAFVYRPGIFDAPRHGQIAVVDVATREMRVLTTGLDRNCDPFFDAREPAWDGNDILFGVEDSGNTHVHRVAAEGASPPTVVIGGELRAGGFDVAGGTVVHVASTVTALPELFVRSRRLTDAGASFAAVRLLQEAERFTATSADGSEVEAWIMRPVGLEGGRRYPVLLNIHGGPFTQYGTGFFDEFQVYAGAGYAVLFSNPRGSAGYAEAWGRAIRGPVDGGPGWGSVDYEDLMAVVDEALRRYDFCDPERVGVMGGSYGGFMTSWIVGHTDRFAAACSERAVNNWLSMYGSSDIGWTFRSYFGAFAYEDVDAYLRHSPSSYATDIRTPLLILHSEKDLRCPIEQAEQLFTTLRLLGREVELVRFPGESHELSRSGSPAHRVMRFEALLEWFDRHLRSGPDRELAAAGRTTD